MNTQRRTTYEIIIPKRPTYVVVGVVVLILLFALFVKLSRSKQPDSVVLFENVGTWKTYRNDTYGFEFKHPSYLTPSYHTLEYSTKTAVDINYGWDMLRILTDQEGVGFEQGETTTFEPLSVDGKDVQINGKPIRKTKVVRSANSRTNSFYLLFINYPHIPSKTMMVNYGFKDGVINDQSNKLFDKIISTLTFFDPGKTSVLNPTGVTTFQSKYLKLSFRYPSEWGQGEEDLEPGDTGKAYLLTFDGGTGGSALGFRNITAGGRSKDYSAARGGYVVDAASGFYSPQEFCSSHWGRQGVTCDVMNQNIVSQLVIPKYEEVCPPNPSQYWFSKRVWVNLSGQEVDGFMMEYGGFWSNQFTEMASPDLDCSKTDKQKFETMVSQITKKLQTGNVDPETKENIEGFDAFVKSIAID